MSTLEKKPYYKRTLPHFQDEGMTYFITFRLAFTLPENVLQKIRVKRLEFNQIFDKLTHEEKIDMQKEYFYQNIISFDELVEKYQNQTDWIKIPEISDIIQCSLFYHDGKKYDLVAFTLMPNHVHLILTPLKNINQTDYSISGIMHSIKSYSAKKCNQILKQEGQFWYHENFEHTIRDNNDMQRCLDYVINNPVKAGLVEEWTDWKYTYVSKEFCS